MRRQSSQSSPPDGTAVYEVQKADSLASVAAQFSTTTSVLKSINRLMCDLVFPGQMIFVPVVSQSESSTCDNSMDKKPLNTSSASDAVSRSQGLSHSGKLPGQLGKPDVISVRFVPPRALSPEEVTVISERCDQRFIKLHVSRILDDEDDPVGGVMLVTPDFVMFDPDEGCASNSALRCSATVAMNAVLSVAVYHDDQLRRFSSAAAIGEMTASRCEEDSLLLATDDIDASCQADDNSDKTHDDKTSVTVADDDADDKLRDDVDKSDKTADAAGDNESLSAKLDLNEGSGCTECHSDMKPSDSETSTDTRPSCSPSNNRGQVSMCLCITVDTSCSSKPSSPPSSPTKIHHASSSSADTCFWYFVPYDKVDELYAFFIQWSPNIEADEEGFVVVSRNNTPQSASDHSIVGPLLLRTTSITKDWEIINVRELRRRLSEAELENLPLPELSRRSDILQDFHLRTLMGHLPARAEGGSWRLLYSAGVHGYSLRTLYRQMTGIDSPILLIVMDTQQHVFGTMQLIAIRRSDLFYGTGESYLFTFYPEFQKFSWTGANSYFTKADEDGLCFGAGRGCYGLWLDESLYHGTTRNCSTYDNRLLTTSEDFTIACLEVWGFN